MYYTTFWTYIQSNDIEIPIIQRDYAQGRLGKENLRKNFLRDLKNALDNDGKKMKLDFVYGSMEEGKLYPLDGQQRLTTLWLLHWYIALRAGELNNDNCAILKKFTYETRISSREFCEKLCEPEKFENFNGNDIVGFITKQTWFYSAWKQDPTIQSMLRMLGGTKIADKKGEDIIDGIEELFVGTDDYINYWNKLTSDDSSIIFYHLPLQDFGLSDDLYIKMNARGKQLTSFENFKADLIGYVTKQSEDETSDESKRTWNKLLDAGNGIPIKLDTDWTDIFWKNRSKGIKDKDGKLVKSNQIDEIFFAFMNRFFWNELFIAKESNNPSQYLLDLGKSDEGTVQENENASYKYLNDSSNRNPNDYDTKIAYQGLDEYKYDNGIPIEFFLKLQKVLNNYFKYSKTWTLPTCPWDSSFRFIPQYIEGENSDNIEIINNANEKILRVSTLNQVQRIVFFAICKYFDHDETVKDSEDSMKRWIRVVWNLVSGEDQNGHPEIRSTYAMRSAIVFIDSLDSHKVYESLRDYDINKLGNSSFEERCKEEVAKAKQIIDENKTLRKYNGSCKKEDCSDYQSWEEIIIEAETYAFFKGAIRFLFTDGEGNVTDESWSQFDTKFKNAKEYFDGNGIKEEYKVELTKKLVIQCNDWENQLRDKKIFNPNASTWKWILCSANWDCQIHNILTMELEQIQPVDSNKDPNIQQYFTPLLNKLPFEWMIINIPEGRFRWSGPRLAYYKPYGREYILFDWHDFKRHKILSNIKENSKYTIIENHLIDNSCFFLGWDVQFKYEDYFFQWQGYNFVRMIDNLDNCEPVVKDESKEIPEEKWYCFRPTSEMTSTMFTKELDKLIEQLPKS